MKELPAETRLRDTESSNAQIIIARAIWHDHFIRIAASSGVFLMQGNQTIRRQCSGKGGHEEYPREPDIPRAGESGLAHDDATQAPAQAGGQHQQDAGASIGSSGCHQVDQSGLKRVAWLTKGVTIPRRLLLSSIDTLAHNQAEGARRVPIQHDRCPRALVV